MEKYNGFGVDGSALYTRYSNLDTDNVNCLKILKEIDNSKRKKLIDNLVINMSKSKEENGFFANNDEVKINSLFMQGFKIDDNDIYYTFFDNIEKMLNKYSKFNIAVINAAIKTEYDYFGNIVTKDTMSTRERISQCYFDENDNYIVPSIKEYKNKNCGACVEYSSVAHNLLLLAGFKSFYVVSKDVQFQNSDTNDGHAFLIIENQNHKTLVLDIVNNTIKILNQNPIKDMFNNKPLIIDNNCYANASKMQEKERI